MLNVMRVLPSWVIVACIVSGCGGGDGGETPAPAPTAEGLWIGSTNTARTVTGIVLDNGTFWVLYSVPNSGIIAGGVQGTSTSINGSFSSFDARDFNLEGAGINDALVSGSYSAKQLFNGTVTYPSLNQAVAYNSVFNPAYDLTPSLGTIAGTYSGNAGVLGGTDTTLFVTQNGSVTGIGTNGCTFAGTVSPHAKGNVYDISITFGGGVCSNGTSTVTGIGYFDAGSNRLYAAALNGTRTNGFIYSGFKQP